MNPNKMRGLVIDDTATRLAEYLRGFRKELYALAHSAGLEHPGEFTPDKIEVSCGINTFQTLEEIMGYIPDAAPFASIDSLFEPTLINDADKA